MGGKLIELIDFFLSFIVVLWWESFVMGLWLVNGFYLIETKKSLTIVYTKYKYITRLKTVHTNYHSKLRHNHFGLFIVEIMIVLRLCHLWSFKFNYYIFVGIECLFSIKQYGTGRTTSDKLISFLIHFRLFL